MIDFTGLLNEMLTTFSQSIPRFISALFIVIVGFIVAKLVSGILKKILKKIQIDKIGDKLNEVDIIQKSSVEIKISTLVSKVLYYMILLFFMVAATDVLDMPAISELVKDIFNLIPNLIVAGIILIVGVLFGDAIRGIVKTACESLGIPSAKLISMVVFYFILINVLVSALSQAKVNTAFLSQNISLVIGGAILAFAIGYGLASKDSVSNFLASQYVNDKIKPGDRIKIDSYEGQVSNIDKSSVTLETQEGKVIIPLRHVGDSRIEVLS